MNKKIFFFILFFLTSFLNKSLFSDTFFKQPFCEGDYSNLPESNKQSAIKKITVEVNKYKKWSKNGIDILIGNFRWIPDKFKKRYKAKIKVRYENGINCEFKAKIRQNGDQKDHLEYRNNSLLQSIDVNLIEGNINGITSFKLLLKNTRGKYTDEVFLNTLLRKFNYLAPRTMMVNTSINSVEGLMIFQEKAVKEMLEINSRREGPILESDEKFVFELARKLPDNNLSNESLGMLPLIERGVDAMLSRQANSKLIRRNDILKEMSFDAISELNLIYLLFHNNHKNEKNNFNYYDYKFDNKYLALGQFDKIQKLNVYDLIIQSFNGWHGLSANNRKFFWNSTENYFEPIAYDTNANLDYLPSKVLFPFSENIENAFKQLNILLENLDIVQLNKEINFNGIKQSTDETNKIIKKIYNNLNHLREIYVKTDKKDQAYNNNLKLNIDAFSKYLSSLKGINKDTVIVIYNEKKEFISCINSICENENFTQKELELLSEGKLIKKGYMYQFFGKSLNELVYLKESNYTKAKIGNIEFYYDKNIKFDFDKNQNILNLYQLKSGGRAYFIDSRLNNLSINFYGSLKNLNDKPFKGYSSIDKKNLTGCLSIINSYLDSVNIFSSNSTCEDSINLINVKGHINNVEINNSFQDGLDSDFSNYSIKSLTIKNSNNDCLDVSYGNYKVNNIFIQNCGDKGISVGEKSMINLKNIKISNVNIGIASKDSSITYADDAEVKEVTTCLAAYNKKQEFSGGFIKAKNIKCNNFDKLKETDAFSRIDIN